METIGVDNLIYIQDVSKTSKLPSVGSITFDSPSNINNNDCTEEVESIANNSSNGSKQPENNTFIVKRNNTRVVSYETLVWVVFFICNIAILIDRFTGNGDRIFQKKGTHCLSSHFTNFDKRSISRRN